MDPGALCLFLFLFCMLRNLIYFHDGVESGAGTQSPVASTLVPEEGELGQEGQLRVQTTMI